MRESFHRGTGQRPISAMMIGMAFSAVAWIGKSEMEGGLDFQLGPGAHMTVQAAVAHEFLRPERRMTGGTITL
ncbi:MAG: hypothetical protein MUO58_06675 [Anaerolineales bacterium]|nr:hypothetical protein [Anaerolineales bacterium]